MNSGHFFASCKARARLIGKVVWLAVNRYVETDGELRAASFAYYAFFALFPLTLLFISIASWFIGDENKAAEDVLGFLNHYVPVGAGESNLIAGTIEEVVASTLKGITQSRGWAGTVAVAALLWSALRFFQSLVQGVNRAWGLEAYSWWRLPITNLAMVGITGSTLLLGVLVPMILRGIVRLWQSTQAMGLELVEYSFNLSRVVLPSIILFYGLLMFYKYAPRRKTSFREVWVSAALAAIFLQLVAKGFVFYAEHFARFNKIYGALGSVVAVLMWIYLSGSVIIFCGCLSAAQNELSDKKK